MPQQKPLSAHELAQLGDFLATACPDGMNLETIHGFFTALHCCPDPVPHEDFLLYVFGGNLIFEDGELGMHVLSLLNRYYLMVHAALTHTLIADAYPLLLAEDEDGRVKGHDWADGFIRGAALREESWRSLISKADGNISWQMRPILLLRAESDPKLKQEMPDFDTPEDRKELIESMVAAVIAIYRHFEPERRAMVEKSGKKRVHEFSRNEHCPCGSGEKYKDCCALVPEKPPTLH